MNESPQPPVPVTHAPIPQRLIGGHVRCVECGADLYRQYEDAACHACSAPVQATLRRYYLRYASPEWVRRVASGLTLVIVTGVACLIAVLGFGAWGAYVGLSRAGLAGGSAMTLNMREVQIGATIIGVPLFVLQLIGLWRLTTRNLADARNAPGSAARAWIRRWLWAIGAVWVPSAAIGLIPEAALQVETRSWLAAALQPVAFAASAPLAVLVLVYLGHLMGRAARPGLLRYARIVLWGVAIPAIPMVACQLLLVRQTAQMTQALYSAGHSPAGAPVPSRGFGTGFTVQVPVSGPTSAPAAYPWSGAPSGPTWGPSPAGIGMTDPAMLGVTMFSGCASCVFLGFGVAGFVLLLMARAALGVAAREAQRNAAASGATPGVEPGQSGSRAPTGGKQQFR